MGYIIKDGVEHGGSSNVTSTTTSYSKPASGILKDTTNVQDALDALNIHNHSGTYQPVGNYASSSHTHDDRYYTESEMNAKLGSKSNLIDFTILGPFDSGTPAVGYNTKAITLSIPSGWSLKAGFPWIAWTFANCKDVIQFAGPLLTSTNPTIPYYYNPLYDGTCRNFNFWIYALLVKN